MKSLVCNYAVARFMPYRETGEFVNIGVVAAFPQRGILLYRFEHRRYGRITNFFPELNVQVYQDAQKAVEGEVKRVSDAFFDLFDKPGYGHEQVEVSKTVFNDIIRVRESMIYFSEPGMLLCNDPHAALDKLYQTHIERQFAKRPEYQEQVMQEQVRHLLKEWNLADYYSQDQPVGTDDYAVKFPFVHFRGEKPVNAIRPLSLDKRDSSEIYQHGDKLLSAIRRLNSNSALPENLIIPVREPLEAGQKRIKAAKIIENELKAAGATVIPFEEKMIHRAALIDLRPAAG